MPIPHKLDQLKLLELRANAKVMAESLQNERHALAGRRDNAAPLKDIYDAVYLPRIAALADQLAVFDIPELELLRQPLDPPRASAQLAALVEVLLNIVVILSPN